ncbi:MAG: DJ-1 family glyoxalase III [Desulfopila sp.]
MKIMVPVANGIEMIEALTIVDVFRRAGATVDIASVNDRVITSSHNVKIEADKLIDDCVAEEYDLIAVPGGIPGAENLRDSATLAKILQKQNGANRLYGAICASPAVVLQHHGLLEGKNATCHPMFFDNLDSEHAKEKTVVFDQNCVTSRGAGTALDFSLELVAILMGEDKRKEVARGMALPVA